MKTRMIHLAAGLALILLIPVLLRAQMPFKQPLMRVNIPFAFIAGGAHLPAGQYFVHHPGDPYFIVIERDDGRARAMVYVHPSAVDPSDSSTKLVFNKYGEQYFLSELWSEHDQEVHHCIKSRMEKGLLAQVPQPKLVVVAVKQ